MQHFDFPLLLPHDGFLGLLLDSILHQLFLVVGHHCVEELRVEELEVLEFLGPMLVIQFTPAKG